jgi:acetyl esterase/lipase
MSNLHITCRLIFFVYACCSCFNDGFIEGRKSLVRPQVHSLMTSNLTVKSGKSSLEAFIVRTIRFGLNLVPLNALRAAANHTRFLLKLVLNLEKKLTISGFTAEVDEIRLHESLQHADGSDCVIYIHGGGFSCCDSSDLMIAERLLLDIGDNPPLIYSILYDTSESYSGSSEGSYIRMQSQVLRAYDDIVSTGKNILCIIGDSAGAALALSVMVQLQRRDRDIESNSETTCITEHPTKMNKVGGLILLSPWLDIFSLKESHFSNAELDILDGTFLSKSARQYLGTEIYDAGRGHSLEIVAMTLAEKLISMGIKVVIFDMDQCMVAMHSMGRLRRDNFLVFVSKTSDDFIIFARALHLAGVKLAVATHSDSAEYNALLRPRTEYIIGEELVEKLLEAVLPEISDYFKIVAYNPTVQGDKKAENGHKKKHVREISFFYGVKRSECILFDDDEGNVKDTDNLFKAFAVHRSQGFRLNSVLVNQLKPESFSDITSSGGIQCSKSNVSKFNPILDAESSCSSRDEIARETTRAFWTDLGLSDPELIFPSLMSPTQLSLLPPTLMFAGAKEIFIDDITSFSDRLVACNTRSSTRPERDRNGDGDGDREMDKDGDREWRVIDRERRNLHSEEGTKGDQGERKENQLVRTDSYSPMSVEERYSDSAHMNTAPRVPVTPADPKMIMKSRVIVAEGEVHVYPIFWRHPFHRVLSPVGLSWLFGLFFPDRVKESTKSKIGKCGRAVQYSAVH